ncbi:hypothetical protein ACLKA6_010331 [Drosophila palustris]
MPTKFRFTFLLLLLLALLVTWNTAQTTATTTTTTTAATAVETTTTGPLTRTGLVRDFVRQVNALIAKLVRDVQQLTAVDNSNINIIA